MVSEAQIKIKEVQQPKVHFEILMLKLVHMNRTQELNNLIGELSGLKKKFLNKNHQSVPVENKGNTPDKQDAVPPVTHQAENKTEEKAEKEPAPEKDNLVEKPEPKEPAPPKSSAQQQPNEDEEFQELLMGRPTLGIAEGISSVNGGSETETAVEEKNDEEETEAVSIKSVHDVEEHWNRYLDTVKENVPKTLYFQMLRVRLRDLKGATLVVSADNELAKNLLAENEKMLAALFKKTIGTRLRLKCVVERKEKNREASMSPYDRFKELQKKDKNLQTIVELFGAELEY